MARPAVLLCCFVLLGTATGCRHKTPPAQAAPKPAPASDDDDDGTPPPPPPAPPPAAPQASAAGDGPVLPLNPNGESPTILVMPLHAEANLVGPAHALDELILTGLAKLRHYQVLGPEDINALVGVDKMKDAAGCDDVACAAQLGGALNAQYLVAGRLTPLGDEAVLSLRLLDTKASRILSRGTARGSVSADAMAQMSTQALDDLLNMQVGEVKDVREPGPAARSQTGSGPHPVKTGTPSQRQVDLDAQLSVISDHLRRGQISTDQALELSAHAAVGAAAYSHAADFFLQLMQRSGTNDDRWFTFAAQRAACLENIGANEDARRLLLRARDRNYRMFRVKGMQEMLARIGNAP